MNKGAPAEYNRVIAHAIELRGEAADFLQRWNEGEWEILAKEWDYVVPDWLSNPTPESMNDEIPLGLIGTHAPATDSAVPDTSPALGEAGVHQELFIYALGNYDVGTIKLEGFTLISNADLAQLRKGLPIPIIERDVPGKLSTNQTQRLRGYINQLVQAAINDSWSGGGDPADKQMLADEYAGMKASTFGYIRKLAQRPDIEPDPA